MANPLMPKATAVWLLENTALTFDQIADFCGLHILEIQAIADGDAAVGMVGLNPLTNGQLTPEEIERCTLDPVARLQMHESPALKNKRKGAKYTPLARRHDRPDAIAWVLKYHPELSDAQVVRLLGTTKSTIAAIRGKTHWNTQQIKPRHPVTLGFCAQKDLDLAVSRAKKEE
jgi:hypothetical protein